MIKLGKGIMKGGLYCLTMFFGVAALFPLMSIKVSAEYVAAGMQAGEQAEVPADANSKGLWLPGSTALAGIYLAKEEQQWLLASRDPVLPQTGTGLSDFVPVGYQLLDQVELDFNEDGLMDYVAVLDCPRELSLRPRILFAAAGRPEGGYRLDFQDKNLIRARSEGGVFGDPYVPLTGQDTAKGWTFGIHAYGGSAWKWSEDKYFRYEAGVWYLIYEEDTYGYGPYTTSHSINDYEKGVGIREERDDSLEGDAFEEWEKMWEEGQEPAWDLSYQIALDPAITLQQASARWWLAPDRISELPVKNIAVRDGIALGEESVPDPVARGTYIADNDEEHILYTFHYEDMTYLALYEYETEQISVVAFEKQVTDPFLYQGRIYYEQEIEENVHYQSGDKEDTVGVRLYSAALDGEDRQQVFEYRVLENTDEILEERLPYLALICEAGGNELVVEVYVSGRPHPFYRMKTDGSDRQLIGHVPNET